MTGRCTAAILLWSAAAGAQSPLTLAQAVEQALRNYPSVRVSEEEINRAAAGIRLARTAYLPRIDTAAQINRATRNNVFGMLLPTEGVIPSMSGPVIGSNNFGTAWGSAVGALVTWEPFDFGLRGANVGVAAAQRAQSRATLERTQFEVAIAAADAYLTLAAAEETVKAAQAGVSRGETVARTIGALVKAELRPGADESRTQAELAAARTQLIEGEEAVEVSRAAVSRFVGVDPPAIVLRAPHLFELPAGPAPEQPDLKANPLVREQEAATASAQAQLRALQRSYFPRFYLQGAAYARGTGAETDGRISGGANGLAPNVQDYALGFTVHFPVMERFGISAREAEQTATVRAQEARERQTATDLRAQWYAAAAAERGARRVAENTPVQVRAARAAAEQATARYESGLGNVDEVAEAQRLLTQAEINDGLARLNVWRGLLQLAAAGGDIRPFLAEAGP